MTPCPAFGGASLARRRPGLQPGSGVGNAAYERAVMELGQQGHSGAPKNTDNSLVLLPIQPAPGCTKHTDIFSENLFHPLGYARNTVPTKGRRGFGDAGLLGGMICLLGFSLCSIAAYP